jgi:hypothetical protein
MEIPRLILPFLGQRAYLHGTTLFDALLPFAPPDAELTFKFSQMIRSNCVAVGVAPGEASFAWKSAIAGDAAWHIRPLPATEPLERREYPEPVVGEKVEVSGKTASYRQVSPFTFVSTLIPIHKKLLAAHVQPASPGQWVFTRLDLKRRPAAFPEIELQLAAVFQDQLARSTVLLAGEAIGSIYFSWLPTK